MAGAHTEMDSVEGVPVGRDPRRMDAVELEALGRPRISRGDAIRAKCIECAGNSPAEVRRCGAIDCALWPFRMGTDPYREKREMSDEARAVIAERFARARKQKEPRDA